MAFMSVARQARATSRFLYSRMRVCPLVANEQFLQRTKWQRLPCAMESPILSTRVGFLRTKVSERVVLPEENEIEPTLAFDDSEMTIEDASIENLLKELNEVFEIIAAVPLMDEEEYGEVRQHFESGSGLDEIDERGYNIKAGTHKIWKGERDLTKIVEGLDTDSAQILQRILLHTLNIERKVREMLSNGGVDPDDKDELQEDNQVI
ncbi:uncharacterized protein CCR75_006240 [Bremia lactucae]|uniref:Uncharacterized protein n=1 Tax=Bremia lactucae TaxID=4779 RepID=A0A976FL35_BRELC|nr:hypothetical protein CCR75_001532 [Bremia lactucae]TDH64903.1 hypothetical protein CCR75_005896 [Bremia lactucae]TDH64924.1 hypothetical protein CCR75_008562 [Bremia lactucae]TDH64984.1 hypothetical protein CCR75_000607 [Bremia lactucae]TDH65103.1 hypothetical protein CCR75_006823 [Bremia lactucae]